MTIPFYLHNKWYYVDAYVVINTSDKVIIGNPILEQYAALPFGLVNAPSTFARYMVDLFRDLDFAVVYLDDILIFSSTKEEHWQQLDKILSHLKELKLIAKKR